MQSNPGHFRFNDLSTELALEVIRLAAAPTLQHCIPSDGRRHYADALSLSRVSSAFYHATMPHLLSAVVLTNDGHLVRFAHALQNQIRRHRTCPRLALDYSSLVRRMWITDCFVHVCASKRCNVDYGPVLDLIRTAEVGFGTISIELLSSFLASWQSHLPRDWPVGKQISFAGPFLRWNPLVSTCEGQAFLQAITHLILWDGSDDASMRKCLKKIPFAQLPNLSHLAVSSAPGHMLVYVGENGTPAPKIFQEWCSGQDPTVHGVTVPFKVELEDHWGGVYARGENNVIWEVAAHIRRKGH